MGRQSRIKKERKLQRIEDTLFGPDQLYVEDSPTEASEFRNAVESAAIGAGAATSILVALPLGLVPDWVRFAGYGGVWVAGLFAWLRAKRHPNRWVSGAWMLGLTVWAAVFTFLF